MEGAAAWPWTCFWLSRLSREIRQSAPIPFKTNTSRPHLRPRPWPKYASSASARKPPITIGSTTTGAGSGKAKLKELVIEKSVDKLSRSLFAISVTGGHLARMQLYVRKVGGAPTAGAKPYLVYGFDMVFISEIDWSGSSGDEEPLERVTFAYGALALGYYPLKPDGTFDTAVKTNWSQVTNSAPPPDPVLAGF